MSHAPATHSVLSLPREVVDSLPDPLGIYTAIRDASGNILDFRIDYVNAAACAANHMTAEDQVGERLCEILPAHRTTGLFAEYCQLVETGTPIEKNDLLYTDDYGGKVTIPERSFWVRAWKVGDGFAAMWRVLPLVPAPPPSVEASEHTRAIIDSLGAFVGLLTPEGILVEANRTALEAAGLKPEDVLGKPFEEAYWWSYSPAIQAQLREAIHRVANGETIRYDVPIRIAEERCITIDFRLVPQTDAKGRVIYMVPSAVDVTEREAILQRLRENEERFRATFDHAAIGIAHIGLGGEWLRVNQALCAITGYTREELFARTFQDITHPDDLNLDLERFEQLKRGDISTYALEKRYFRKSGETIWIHLTVSLVPDATPPYCISVIEDITERKRQQEEIKDLNARLQRAMSETHHRVKNNLQVIAALVEISVGDAAETVPLAAVSRIGQHIRTLADLHDLLTQQANAGEHTDTISVQKTLVRLTEYLRLTTPGRPIHLQAEDAAISVRGGASLALLVNELVANAVKHGRGEIGIRLGVTNGMAELEVYDNGPGFPPDFHPETAANTGLSLIESAGQYDLRGNVTFGNRPEGGASVLVHFPLTTTSPPRRNEVSSGPLSQGKEGGP